MLHYIKQIAENYSKNSELRKDKKLFNYHKFILFAESNINKYNIVKENDMLMLSTWHSEDLITDYIKTLK